MAVKGEALLSLSPCGAEGIFTASSFFKYSLVRPLDRDHRLSFSSSSLHARRSAISDGAHGAVHCYDKKAWHNGDRTHSLYHQT